jgi:hypothetical protein
MDMNVLENFERWKEFLGEQVDKAKEMGISQEKITNVAEKMGTFLSSKVDPKNAQERLLKQLWDASSTEERHTLASIMVKMADNAH